jgi:hypothetical protein
VSELIVELLPGTLPGPLAAPPAPPPPAVQEVARFEAALQDADAARALLEPLERLNAGARSLADAAARYAGGGELKPSEMLLLTVRAHEFLFECQVTSTVANKASDGVQELFRQQS